MDGSEDAIVRVLEKSGEYTKFSQCVAASLQTHWVQSVRPPHVLHSKIISALVAFVVFTSFAAIALTTICWRKRLYAVHNIQIGIITKSVSYPLLIIIAELFSISVAKYSKKPKIMVDAVCVVAVKRNSNY